MESSKTVKLLLSCDCLEVLVLGFENFVRSVHCMKICSIICFSGENKKGPCSVTVFQISDKILRLNIKTKILTEKTDLLTNITLAQTCLAQFVVSAIMVIFRNYGNPSNKSNFHFSNKSCLPSIECI